MNAMANDAYSDGFAEGRDEGYEEGYENGAEDGYMRGYESGYEDGECAAEESEDSLTRARLEASRINPLEPFVGRWDAAAGTWVVSQGDVVEEWVK